MRSVSFGQMCSMNCSMDGKMVFSFEILCGLRSDLKVMIDNM